jgi:hypothetical protein
LREIVSAARIAGLESSRLPSVQEVVTKIDNAVSDSLEGETLRDLVLAQGSETPEIQRIGGNKVNVL